MSLASGWLFKHDYKTKNKAELLIFIHPRIL
jgi:type II secretory pathway component HofQ